MATLPPVVAELRAVGGEFFSTLGKAQSEVKKLGDSGSHFQRLQTAGKVAFASLAGGFVAVATAGISAADEFEKSHARLVQAFLNSGQQAEAWTKEIDAASSHMEKLGFTNAETQDALANLTTALGNPQKAFKDLGLAADLARFKHISLADAATTLARAEEGQLRPLRQLGIDLPLAAGGALKLQQAHAGLQKATDAYSMLLDRLHGKHKLTIADHQALEKAQQKVHDAEAKVNSVASASVEIHNALAKAIGGQATAASETFAGKMQRLHAQVKDVEVRIGTALIPVLEKLAGITGTVVGWLQKHQTEAKALAVIIGGVLTVAIGAYFVGALEKASKALTLTGRAAQLFGAQAAEGEAAAELPLLPWIAAIAAVGIAAYELYKHWDAVWGFIKRIMSDAKDFIVRHVHLIALGLAVLFGPIGLLVAAALELATHWRQVWSGMQQVVGEFVSLFIGYVKMNIDIFFTFIEGILKAASHLPFVGHYFKSAYNAVHGFKEQIDGTLSGIAASAGGWGKSTGENFGYGLAAGVQTAGGAAVKAAVKLATTVHQSVNNILRNSSPSKVAMEAGRNFAQGLALGLADPAALRTVAEASARLGGSVFTPTRTPTFAAAVGHETGRAGLVIHELNVHSAPGEQAADSVPRALRNLLYVHGIS